MPAQVSGSWQSDIRPVDTRLVREETASPTAAPRSVDPTPDAATTTVMAPLSVDPTAPEALGAAPTPAPLSVDPTAPPEPDQQPLGTDRTTLPSPLNVDPAVSSGADANAPTAEPTRTAHVVTRSAQRRGAVAPSPAAASRRRPGRALTRVGVLTTLAAVTVVIPVSQGATAGTAVISGEPLTSATLPNTVSALTAAPASMLPPASLVPTDGAVAARALASAASRDETRSLLPGCDPAARAAGSNGLLAEKDLCTLWDGHTRLRADAASSLAEFNAAYVARFGADMCLASGYRTLAEQRSVKARKGGLAAAPGKSNHGWGLAVDFCSELTSGERWTWINQNAPMFGWENPAWAKPGGSGPYEKWHWEYTKGVKADGEYYG
ncbi:MAG TPA: D-alanyl-D-alanine carboxypeptidase family protein [Cellulomonas sp.]|nr:D-alanyl-D-alanine carboxypeptidase family protein [Cellulomonas sp.]